VYVGATSRRTKEGTVRYLQLAHSEWDAEAGMSRPKILFSFGREDQLDRAAIERLIAALSRLLDPGAAHAATSSPDMPDLSVAGSRAIGGTHVLDALWHRLGIDAAIREQLTGRRLDPRVERVLFALVAGRALAPSSKLAATDWIGHDTHIAGLDQINDDACYRAMDYLLTIEPTLAEQIYFHLADLLNLEVDLLFFDTTSTYFELDEPDAPAGRDADGHLTDEQDQVVKDVGRSHGKSKDSRDDLPQVVVGMAVTRDGIPVRCWSWPGSTETTKTQGDLMASLGIEAPKRILDITPATR
jgi:hypothetical protein